MTNPFGLAPAADVDHQRRADRRPSSTGCGSLVRWAGGVVLCALLAGGLAERGAAQERSSAVADRRDDLSPWGVASGAEWFNAYPQFMPVLRRAGVGWLRGFYEWQIIQPVPGRWNFTLPDALVRTAACRRWPYRGRQRSLRGSSGGQKRADLRRSRRLFPDCQSALSDPQGHDVDRFRGSPDLEERGCQPGQEFLARAMG